MSATILLADSNASTRSSLEELLLKQGYRVMTAEDGEGALDECTRFQPDLILLDDALPDCQGLDACRRVKANPAARFTPVLLLAGCSSRSGYAHGAEAGADGFLTKPVRPGELLSRVQDLLSLKVYVNNETESVLLSLARSIEGRDPYTEGHCERLSGYAARLGRSLGLDDGAIHALSMAGVVHDIGKVAVPDHILLKPGPLTPDEEQIMHKHPVEGERICAPLKAFRNTLPIIRHHHERMDGSGYPDGLRNYRIPLAARILQIVDIYDALTSDRPYHRALLPAEALSILRDEARCGWCDPVLVDEWAQLAGR